MRKNNGENSREYMRGAYETKVAYSYSKLKSLKVDYFNTKKRWDNVIFGGSLICIGVIVMLTYWFALETKQIAMCGLVLFAVFGSLSVIKNAILLRKKKEFVRVSKILKSHVDYAESYRDDIFDTSIYEDLIEVSNI